MSALFFKKNLRLASALVFVSTISAWEARAVLPGAEDQELSRIVKHVPKKEEAGDKPHIAQSLTGLNWLRYQLSTLHYTFLHDPKHYGDELASLGNDLYNEYNYPLALEVCQEADLMGSSRAQRIIGAMYAYGQGVVQNHDIALGWFQKAFRRSKYDKALLDTHVLLNLQYDIACSFFNHGEHQTALRYFDNIALYKDYFYPPHVLPLYALYYIGLIHLKGYDPDVPQNDQKAVMYFREVYRGRTYRMRQKHFEQHLIKNLLDEGNKRFKAEKYPDALKLYKEASYYKSKLAKRKVGLMILNGQGEEVNNARALVWLWEGNDGSPHAISSLAEGQFKTGASFYESQNMTEASQWLEQAAAKGHDGAIKLKEEISRKKPPLLDKDFVL